MQRIGYLDKSEAPYTVLPATEEDVLWAAETAKRVYSGLDVIPPELMLEWFAANPTGFSVTRDRHGRRCGNVDILPLKPATLARLLRGDIIELEIRADCLFRPGESHLIDSLYIESLVAVTDGGRPSAVAAYRCLFELPRLVRRVCAPRQVGKVYALGASPGGVNLLRHLGFAEVPAKRERRDGHGVFWAGLAQMTTNIAGLARGEAKLELARFLEELE